MGEAGAVCVCRHDLFAHSSRHRVRIALHSYDTLRASRDVRSCVLRQRISYPRCCCFASAAQSEDSLVACRLLGIHSGCCAQALASESARHPLVPKRRTWRVCESNAVSAARRVAVPSRGRSRVCTRLSPTGQARHGQEEGCNAHGEGRATETQHSLSMPPLRCAPCSAQKCQWQRHSQCHSPLGTRHPTSSQSKVCVRSSDRAYIVEARTPAVAPGRSRARFRHYYVAGGHDSVTCKIDREQKVGTVTCNECSRSYAVEDCSPLHEAVDVYAEWIDACEAANE